MTFRREDQHAHDDDLRYEQPRLSKTNLPLLRCGRDTNNLEGEHARMNNTAGKRNIGLEYADHLFAERRHRSTI